MTATRSELRALEGKQVSVMLIDGTRLDACSLVSAGRASVRTLWVLADGETPSYRSMKWAIFAAWPRPSGCKSTPPIPVC